MTLAGAFTVVAVLSAMAATLLADFRRAALALWLAGMAVGAAEIALGAEFVGFAQWMISTVSAVCFVVYAVNLGEFEVSGPASGGLGASSDAAPDSRVQRGLRWFAPVLLGLAFAGIVQIGVAPIVQTAPEGHATELTRTAEKTDLLALGQSLVGEHFIALELVGLILFLCLIGVGVIGRPMMIGDERERRGEETKSP